MKLSGKVAIVTGGSRGIGRATAALFAREGADVVITARDDHRVKSAAAELGVAGFAGDVRNYKDVETVVKKTLDKFGKVDILVNNAGIFPQVRPLHEVEEKEWNDVIDINLTGQFRFTKAVIPHMLKNGGCIVNVSSDAGIKSFENFEADAYSVSKAALIHFTRTLAAEYAKYKIRVNCVCPGIVETDMTEPFLRTEADRAMAVAEHPIGRIGLPEDVAHAILYFASEDSSWITGAILPVDGGVSTK
ncbi:MAG TPA: SDR family NAD(P)-dependent oxidoreductase [Candidatus Nitrosotalea sp.]|nr:SDR family NAD(P)-dependent oxidoreductase [Candidatus Nitrosotalea sp.]